MPSYNLNKLPDMSSMRNGKIDHSTPFGGAALKTILHIPLILTVLFLIAGCDAALNTDAPSAERVGAEAQGEA